MHLLLTDHLTCPRCGPDFGLVVLADRIEERRVVRGTLGCANCRARYAIEGGVADLRAGGEPPALTGEVGLDDGERAVRAAALMGVRQANATLLVIEPNGAVAARVAGLVPEVHVVAGVVAVPPHLPAPGEPGILSAVRLAERLPFRDRAFRGVAILGAPPETLLREACRLLAPGARLVLEQARANTAEALRTAGLEVALEQEGVVVAALPGVG